MTYELQKEVHEKDKELADWKELAMELGACLQSTSPRVKAGGWGSAGVSETSWKIADEATCSALEKLAAMVGPTLAPDKTKNQLKSTKQCQTK
jgi:hypothetical protein